MTGSSAVATTVNFPSGASTSSRKLLWISQLLSVPSRFEVEPFMPPTDIFVPCAARSRLLVQRSITVRELAQVMPLMPIFFEEACKKWAFGTVLATCQR